MPNVVRKTKLNLGLPICQCVVHGMATPFKDDQKWCHRHILNTCYLVLKSNTSKAKGITTKPSKTPPDI